MSEKKWIEEPKNKYGNTISIAERLRLYGKAQLGTLKEVKDAFRTFEFSCSVDAQKDYAYLALRHAVQNKSTHALDIIEYLIERITKPDSYTLNWAALNGGPYVLDIINLLIERGANPHEKNDSGYSAFTESLRYGNTAIADYLLSRDDFFLSDLLSCPNEFGMSDIYKKYSDKAMSRVSELIDVKGISYAKTVSADIKTILETNDRKLTSEDVEALRSLAKKIATKDWVSDAHVSSDDFLDYCMER